MRQSLPTSKLGMKIVSWMGSPTFNACSFARASACRSLRTRKGRVGRVPTAHVPAPSAFDAAARSGGFVQTYRTGAATNQARGRQDGPHRMGVLASGLICSRVPLLKGGVAWLPDRGVSLSFIRRLTPRAHCKSPRRGGSAAPLPPGAVETLRRANVPLCARETRAPFGLLLLNAPLARVRASVGRRPRAAREQAVGLRAGANARALAWPLCYAAAVVLSHSRQRSGRSLFLMIDILRGVCFLLRVHCPSGR
jgi:hypothetical protein